MQQRLRLRRPADFARLRREGTAFHDRVLLLSVAPNDLPHNRYGFVTSKALGNAVTRNRARRQLREAIRRHHPSLRPGHDIVLVGKRAIVGQPLDPISRIVYKLAVRANLVVSPGEDQS
jgi:ribonuclease P protein component